MNCGKQYTQKLSDGRSLSNRTQITHAIAASFAQAHGNAPNGQTTDAPTGVKLNSQQLVTTDNRKCTADWLEL